MRIIQSYNTFGNDPGRLSSGFPTVRDLVNSIAYSSRIHAAIADLTIYTDEFGAALLDTYVDKAYIEVIEFPMIDERIPYVGKFQVQDMVNETYIHVDLDAVLYELPPSGFDVYTEKTRGVSFSSEVTRVGIDRTGIYEIICSGLIGFSDLAFKAEYIENVFDKIFSMADEQNFGYKEFYTIEETLLTRMLIDQGKTLCVLEPSTFEHRYRNVNKIFTNKAKHKDKFSK